MNRAVFLDRDGTIIVHKPYLADPNQVELIPGGPQALKQLQNAGFLLIVVTNQSVIGRGWATREQVDATNARINSLYAQHGVTFDAHYYCPHAPEENCTCRKPKPGLILEAAKDHSIDLSTSYMIGDNPTDIQAGQNANLRKNLFLMGDSHLFSASPGGPALQTGNVRIFNGLQPAVAWLLNDSTTP